MSKFNHARWTEDFRKDGYRGHCIDCDKTFDVEDNESLRTAMVRHYKEKHPDMVMKAHAYMNMLEAEIVKDLKKKDGG